MVVQRRYGASHTTTINSMNMIIKNHKVALTSALAGLLAITVAEAATYAAGDLLMGFRATAGQGLGTSYVVNIGQASTYRDADSFSTVPIAGNFTTDLTDIFGANWHTRTDLLWGIAGTPSNVVAVAGDEAATMYASKAQTTPGAPGAAWTIAGLSTRTSVSTLMTGMQSGYAGYTASTNSPAGTIQVDTGTSDSDWRSYLATGGDASRTSGNRDFGGFSNIEGDPTQALSLFRLDGPNNVGSFEGTFAISPAGLTFVPEPASSALAVIGAATLMFRRRRSA